MNRITRIMILLSLIAGWTGCMPDSFTKWDKPETPATSSGTSSGAVSGSSGAVTGPTGWNYTENSVTVSPSSGSPIILYIDEAMDELTPEITGFEDDEFEFTAYNYDVTANLADCTPITAATSSLPSGVSMDTTTGVISGTPTSYVNGQYTIKAEHLESGDTSCVHMFIAPITKISKIYFEQTDDRSATGMSDSLPNGLSGGDYLELTLDTVASDLTAGKYIIDSEAEIVGEVKYVDDNTNKIFIQVADRKNNKPTDLFEEGDKIDYNTTSTLTYVSKKATISTVKYIYEVDDQNQTRQFVYKKANGSFVCDGCTNQLVEDDGTVTTFATNPYGDDVHVKSAGATGSSTTDKLLIEDGPSEIDSTEHVISVTRHGESYTQSDYITITDSLEGFSLADQVLLKVNSLSNFYVGGLIVNSNNARARIIQLITNGSDYYIYANIITGTFALNDTVDKTYPYNTSRGTILADPKYVNARITVSSNAASAETYIGQSSTTTADAYVEYEYNPGANYLYVRSVSYDGTFESIVDSGTPDLYSGSYGNALTDSSANITSLYAKSLKISDTAGDATLTNLLSGSNYATSAANYVSGIIEEVEAGAAPVDDVLYVTLDNYNDIDDSTDLNINPYQSSVFDIDQVETSNRYYAYVGEPFLLKGVVTQGSGASYLLFKDSGIAATASSTTVFTTVSDIGSVGDTIYFSGCNTFHRITAEVIATHQYTITPAAAAGPCNSGQNIFTQSNTLVAGITMDSTNGDISGTATESLEKTEFVVKVENVLSDVSFPFYLTVHNQFYIENKTANAPSYVLHKSGQGNNVATCRVTQAQIDQDTSSTWRQEKDILCYLEGGELDIYAQGLSVDVNAGKGMCEYVRVEPYKFWQYQYIQTTTAKKVYDTSACQGGCASDLDGDTVVETCAQEVLGLNGFVMDSTINYCDGDYSDNSTPGPNCDDGEYLKYVVEDSDDNGTCDSVSPDIETVDCGGVRAACYGGATLDYFDSSSLENGHDSTITAAFTGHSANWTFSSPLSQSQSSNLYIVNYLASMPFNGLKNNGTTLSSTRSIYSYDYESLEAFSDSLYSYTQTIHDPYIGASPYYTFECLDYAYDLVARIRLVVRDWDRTFYPFNTGGSTAYGIDQNLVAVGSTGAGVNAIAAAAANVSTFTGSGTEIPSKSYNTGTVYKSSVLLYLFNADNFSTGGLSADGYYVARMDSSDDFIAGGAAVTSTYNEAIADSVAYISPFFMDTGNVKDTFNNRYNDRIDWDDTSVQYVQTPASRRLATAGAPAVTGSTINTITTGTNVGDVGAIIYLSACGTFHRVVAKSGTTYTLTPVVCANATTGNVYYDDTTGAAYTVATTSGNRITTAAGVYAPVMVGDIIYLYGAGGCDSKYIVSNVSYSAGTSIDLYPDLDCSPTGDTVYRLGTSKRLFPGAL